MHESSMTSPFVLSTGLVNSVAMASRMDVPAHLAWWMNTNGRPSAAGDGGRVIGGNGTEGSIATTNSASVAAPARGL